MNQETHSWVLEKSENFNQTILFTNHILEIYKCISCGCIKEKRYWLNSNFTQETILSKELTCDECLIHNIIY